MSHMGCHGYLAHNGLNLDIIFCNHYILIGGRVKQAQPFKGFGAFDLGGEFIHGSNTVVNKLALDNGWLILPVSTTCVPVTLTASVS